MYRQKAEASDRKAFRELSLCPLLSEDYGIFFSNFVASSETPGTFCVNFVEIYIIK